jgi:hypothetical protein
MLSPLQELLLFPSRSYISKVKALGPIAYWPMSEKSGSVAYDITGYSRHGAYTGVDLGQPGIGGGETCPYFDGINDYCNVQTASLASAFSGSTGTISAWFRVANAGVWTDSTRREIAAFGTNASNLVNLRRWTTNNRFLMTYLAGGVSSQVDTTVMGGRIDFIHVGFTWNKPADEVKGFIDGNQIGATINGLGNWAGALGASVIGAASVVPVSAWLGYISHVALWNLVLTPDTMKALASK